MFYIVIAVLIWASSFTAGKYAYQMFDAAIVVELRLFIASAIVLPFYIKYRSSINPALKKCLWALSFLMFPIGIMLQFIGLAYTSASSAVTIIGTEPILILLLGFLFFGKKVLWYDWLLSILVFLGIFLLVIGAESDGAVNIKGLLLVFLAGVGFSLSVHLGQDMMQQISPKLYTTTILIQGAILCLPLCVLFTKNWQVQFSWQGILAVMYLGLCCSWLAYKCWNIGLQKTPAHISGMLIALEPVFGVLIAMGLLGERMRLLTALGSVLVIGAAVASTLIPIIKEKTKP